MDESRLTNEARVALQKAVERIERIREEKKGLSADETEVAAEVKPFGISRKALNKFLAERAADQDAADKIETEVDILRRAFG